MRESGRKLDSCFVRDVNFDDDDACNTLSLSLSIVSMLYKSTGKTRGIRKRGAETCLWFRSPHERGDNFGTFSLSFVSVLQ